MKVSVIGATGLVGHTLWRQWRGESEWEVHGTYVQHKLQGMERLDIVDAQAVKSYLERFRPQAVILTASNPFVDYCETHPEETRKINVEATTTVAAAARGIGAKFVFFSSDYVFDGKKAPYKEEDPVCPLNVYGRQKAEAERAIAELGSDHLILRISGAFGWELARKNFVLQLLDRPGAKGPMPVARDVRYNPTYAVNIADVLRELLEKTSSGIFHVVGSQELSRYEFAMEVAKAFDLDPAKIKPVNLVELSSPTPRPLRSSLKIDKVRALVKAPLWDPRQALAHMRQTEPKS